MRFKITNKSATKHSVKVSVGTGEFRYDKEDASNANLKLDAKGVGLSVGLSAVQGPILPIYSGAVILHLVSDKELKVNKVYINGTGYDVTSGNLYEAIYSNTYLRSILGIALDGTYGIYITNLTDADIDFAFDNEEDVVITAYNATENASIVSTARSFGSKLLVVPVMKFWGPTTTPMNNEVKLQCYPNMGVGRDNYSDVWRDITLSLPEGMELLSTEYTAYCINYTVRGVVTGTFNYTAEHPVLKTMAEGTIEVTEELSQYIPGKIRIWAGSPVKVGKLIYMNSELLDETIVPTEVEWTSLNPDIATINSGEVIGVSVGTATVQVILNGMYIATTEVEVIAADKPKQLKGIVGADEMFQLTTTNPYDITVGGVKLTAQRSGNLYYWSSDMTDTDREFVLTMDEIGTPITNFMAMYGLKAITDWSDVTFGVNSKTPDMPMLTLGNDIESVPSVLNPTITSLNSMFSGSSKFNDPNVALWDTSNVVTMVWTFSGATIFNQNISGYKVGKVTDFDGTFNNATAFNQNLSGWCVPNADVARYNFSEGSALVEGNLPVWGTCPNGV